MSERVASRRESSGFTLLEVMVALAILGMVMVALAGGMRFARRAWQAQEQRIDRQEDLDSVQNLLRFMIASGSTFHGDAGTLGFVGAMPLALARGGLFDIELAVSDHQLVMLWRPQEESGGAADMTQTALARGVANIDIRYYVTDYRGKFGTWSESVDKLHRPALVRVVVLFAPGDSRRWAPLVVAPLIDPRG